HPASPPSLPPLSLHAALPISAAAQVLPPLRPLGSVLPRVRARPSQCRRDRRASGRRDVPGQEPAQGLRGQPRGPVSPPHRPAARSEEHTLNSSHVAISYAVFC